MRICKKLVEGTEFGCVKTILFRVAFSSLRQSCVTGVLNRTGRRHFMQSMRMSEHVWKCSCATSTACPMNMHRSTGQAITRLGHTRACWSSDCAGMALKGQPFGQRTTFELKASCAQSCHAGQLRISPAVKLCMQVGHGAPFTDDHCDCGAERIWKGCLINRSQKMC